MYNMTRCVGTYLTMHNPSNRSLPHEMRMRTMMMFANMQMINHDPANHDVAQIAWMKAFEWPWSQLREVDYRHPYDLEMNKYVIRRIFLLLDLLGDVTTKY